MAGGIVLRCPRCRPIGTKVTTLSGRRLGFVPAAEYVGYLVTETRGFHKKPPTHCPECGHTLAGVPCR